MDDPARNTDPADGGGEALRLARGQLQRGDAAGALAAIDRVLATAPDDADALALHGSALLALDRAADALRAFERAIVVRPTHAGALANRGSALLSLGRPDEALDSYDRALHVAPDRAAIHFNRGRALAELQRPAEAQASFERALALDPDDADAAFALGNALAAQGRPEQALAAFDRAIARNDGDAAAWFNRGNALVALHRLDDALASFDRAIALRPDDACLHYNRANVLAAMFRLDEAVAAYDRALALAPDDAAARNNRGNALLALHRPAEALADYGAALARDPAHADALNNRGHALCELGRFDEAGATFERLLSSSPRYPYAAGNLLRCRLHGCDWTGVDDLVRNVAAAVERGEPAVEPLVLLAVTDSPSLQAQCARVYAARVPPAAPLWRGERRVHDRIRVAYLSADFHEHATAHLLAGVLEAHDRSRFDVRGFSYGPASDDPMRARLLHAFDAFHDVRTTSDEDVARMLHQREIDIAIDLKGHTAHGRPSILAHRPAPVQASYLGFPGTLALPFIDYVLGDARVIPPGDECHYTEQVIRLPGSYQANDRTRPVAARAPSRDEVGLPPSAFVFACFNNDYKILPAMFDAWMRIVAAVPGSVLWLLEDTPAVAPNLRREARRRGVDPGRLVFAARWPLADHLARHALADLFLDTVPCNAHTTASDALWAGLPLLTVPGRAFASRVAASLLEAAGLPELVAPDLPGYEAMAIALAHDRARLTALRARLAASRATCPLFDAVRICRALESAYARMHDRAQRGLPPQGFDVPA